MCLLKYDNASACAFPPIATARENKVANRFFIVNPYQPHFNPVFSESGIIQKNRTCLPHLPDPAKTSPGALSGVLNGLITRIPPIIWSCCKSSVSNVEHSQVCAAATIRASHHERLWSCWTSQAFSMTGKSMANGCHTENFRTISLASPSSNRGFNLRVSVA